MSRFRNVEALRNFVPIYEEAEPIRYEDVLEAIRMLELAYLDIEYYIKELMHGEQCLVKLIFPLHDFKICNIVSNDVEDEIFQFSFGSFSLNVWNKIIVDKDNPLLQLLEYFEFYSRGIRNLLAMQGVDTEQLITFDLLDKYKIVDIFSLHSYIGVYDDFQYFIPKKKEV